ncbi:hypothetical protein FAGAP_3615 [Fusarium agapanthi]|uniref:Uncharacterized protein n=1 Tax=Fusarium agapanthi TaxID=1803897 RepID=A0A9P5BGR2_9HYPO|nr:hypothetical protein FAGAP_3615 [Fusarium agapanthi]
MHASAAVFAFVAVAAAAQTPVAPVATPVATPGAPTNGTKPGSTPANGAAALGLSGLAGAFAVALAL